MTAVAGCVASVWLTARLFGTTAAGYFAFTNFAWLQVSYLGGSELLALALGLGSLLAFRRDRIVVSALLASLAVTVRPLMFFALVGIGLVLLYRKQFWQFLAALGIGLGIGILYVLPLARYFGDPCLTVHTYTSRDYGAAKVVGPHEHLFGWPFHGIVVGTMTYPAPWTNLVLSFFWIALVLLGAGMMFSSNFRKYANGYPNEAISCGLYLFAIFSYDYLIWARSNFIRFCIPTLPFVFFCTVASSAEGPQGDLGLLHGECDGIRRFGCRGKKRISGDALKRPRRAGLPSGGNAYLFKVAGQSVRVTQGIRADP